MSLGARHCTSADLQHLPIQTQQSRTLAAACLTDTRITGAGLGHVERLTSLETLALGYTKITDPSLEHLFGLTKLQALYLTHSQVAGAGVKELRRALPKCNTDIAN